MSVFGEIIEPSSRAIWEDWDDTENDVLLPELKWQNPLEVPEVVDSFFLFEGKYLWDGALKGAKNKIQEVNCIKEVNLHLYKTPQASNYICVIKDCDLMLSNDVVKLLQDIICKTKILTAMVVKPISEYQTAHAHAHPCITRKIVTRNKSNAMAAQYPNLEQPNIISGVSAGVFTVREHLSLSATVLVFYMAHSQEYPVDDIQNLLQNLNLSELKPNPVLNSNLYI